MPASVPIDEFLEFVKHYSATCVKVCELTFHKNSVPTPVLVVGAAGPDNLLTIKDHTRGVLNIKYPSVRFRWDLDLPHRGLFNYQNHVGFYFRIPRRQWKRGICSNNSGISWLTNEWRKSLNSCIASNTDFQDLELINAIYTRQYRSREDVIDDLLTHKLAEEALNEKFAVSLSPFNQEDHIMQLWYETQLIGDMTATHIEVRHEPFLDEVKEYFETGRRTWQVQYTPISPT